MAEPTKELRGWRVELEGKLRQIQDRKAELQVEEAAATRQIRLIDELLSGGEVAADFRIGLRQLLVEQGRPLRLRELRALLDAKGVQIPGKGTDANLIAHLKRIPLVRRVDRGTYAIDGMSSMVDTSAEKTKPKKRRRRKRTATSRVPPESSSHRG